MDYALQQLLIKLRIKPKCISTGGLSSNASSLCSPHLGPTAFPRSLGHTLTLPVSLTKSLPDCPLLVLQVSS